MKLSRFVAAALSLAATIVALTAVPAHATSATAYVTRNVNLDQPLAAVAVKVQASWAPFSADYALTWQLEKFDKPVSGRSGSTSGTLTQGDSNSNGVTAPFDVSAEGLPDGTYEVAGTIEITPTGMSPISLPFSVDLIFDRVGPDITVKTDRTVIYPNAPSGYSLYSPFVQVDVTGPDAPKWDWNWSLRVRRPDGTTVRTLTNSSDAYWNGKAGGAVVPAGTYELVVLDGYGNPSLHKTPIQVNTAAFEKRTWKRTLKADASMIRSTVGRCSALRRPSLRGWAGSLGMYANARCGDRSNAASLVSTRHAVRVPAAALYERLSVESFGGAAAARPNSYALASFLRKDGTLAERHIAYDSYLRLHSIMSLNDPRIRSALLADRTFRWQVEVGHDYRYDVKNYVVTVTYYVMTAQGTPVRSHPLAQ